MIGICLKILSCVHQHFIFTLLCHYRHCIAQLYQELVSDMIINTIRWPICCGFWDTPRKLVIKPGGGVYKVGDRLECSADGNPTPSYEWSDTETSRTINGSFLSIEKDFKPGQNHTFRCTAYNTVDGLKKDAVSDVVTFKVTGEDNNRCSICISLISTF